MYLQTVEMCVKCTAAIYWELGFWITIIRYSLSEMENEKKIVRKVKNAACLWFVITVFIIYESHNDDDGKGYGLF